MENKQEYREIPISTLNFSARTFNALMRAKLNTLYLLIENITELGKIRSMGAKSISEIEEVLAEISEKGFLHMKTETVLSESKAETVLEKNSLPAEILSRPASDLKVSVRICNSFRLEGIETIGQVLALHPTDLLSLKNMGALSQQQLLAQLELLRELGENYFDLQEDDEQSETVPKYSKRELDIATVKRLQDDYGFKTIWLCEWYGLTRQRIYQKLEKKINRGNWRGKELLAEERNAITEMINTKAFYKEETAKYYLLNNMIDDCAFIIVTDDDIKCFFLEDLPMALQARVRNEGLHRFSENECKALPTLGRKVYILKKPYFMPLESYTYRSLANTRGLSNEEYSQFLFGIPYCSAQTSVTDEKIIAFLTENTFDGKTMIPSTADSHWIRSYISRNGYNTNDFIEFYGFNVNAIDATVDFDFTDDVATVEKDMQIYLSSDNYVEKVFAETPLLGSRIISKKNIDILNRNSRKYISRFLSDSHVKPNLKDEMQITLAVINFAKGWNTEDESGFWRYITSQFGYRDESGQLRNLLCNCVKDALIKNNRWFVANTSGNLFKASIVVHAFSTKRSWLYFCDFLFDFYKTNLDWEYIEDDPMFVRMVFALRNKMLAKDVTQDENIEISSKIYNFREGIIKLILYRPKYATQLVSRLIKRIDCLVNHTVHPATCYEEQLCDEWMANKIQGISTARHHSPSEEKRTVAIDYSRIKPIYQLYNESEVRISFPDVRLVQNDFDSLRLTVYHQGDVVEQRNLDFYGNELGKTMVGFTLNLEDYLRKSGSRKFNPQLVITCGSDEIYNSETVLFRDCLMFRNKFEVDISSCEVGSYSIFTPTKSIGEYINADTAIIKETAYLKGFYVSLQKDFVINLNGELVALDNSQNSEIRVMVPSTDTTADYMVNSVRYSVVSGHETIRIISSMRESEKKYRLVINSDQVDFGTLPYEDASGTRIYKVEIGNFGSDEVSLRLMDLANSRLILRRYFKVIRTFSYRFNKPFYFSTEDFREARIRLLIGGKDVQEYPVAQGESRISIPYQDGELEIPVPIVKFIDNVNTEWGGEKLYWIKEIPQERFLYAKVPAGVNVELHLNNHAVSSDGSNAFALGNAIYGYSNEDGVDWLNVHATISLKGQDPRFYSIGKIATKEQFFKKPILTMDGTTLSWDRGYGFIGDASESFKLTICEGTEFKKTCDLDLESENIVEDLQLPLGEYKYTISKQSGNLFMANLQKIVSGSFFVGNENELRFLKSIIEINTITFEDDSKYESVTIRPCYIDHIEYKGVQYVGSEDCECPVYTGIMFFFNDSGRRREYSYEDTIDTNGHRIYQINPVTIVYINDSTLSITSESGDGFYYYRYYDKNAMANVYQITDWDPPENNKKIKDRYYPADLYSYTRKGV